MEFRQALLSFYITIAAQEGLIETSSPEKMRDSLGVLIEQDLHATCEIYTCPRCGAAVSETEGKGFIIRDFSTAGDKSVGTVKILIHCYECLYDKSLALRPHLFAERLKVLGS